MPLIHSNANNIFHFMKTLKYKEVQYLNIVSTVEVMLLEIQFIILEHLSWFTLNVPIQRMIVFKTIANHEP
jgi:hypothetical protein